MTTPLLIGLLLSPILFECNCFITFYQLQGLKGSKMNYTDDFINGGCINLPNKFVGKSDSLDVDGCFQLFDNTNCSGFDVEVTTGQYETLDDFKDKSVSFRPCVTEPVHATFYKDKNHSNILHETELSSEDLDCHAVPESVSNQTKSFSSNICIVLFTNANCSSLEDPLDFKNGWEIIQTGESSTNFFQEGSMSPKSFQVCLEDHFENQEYAENLIQFYSESEDDKDKLVLFMEGIVTDECTNLPKAAHSVIQGVETKQCVSLFNDVDCEGETFTMRPGSDVKLLEGFYGQTVSFSGCENLPLERNQTEDLLGLTERKVILFGDGNFEDVLFNGTVTNYCKTLNETYWDKISSIETEVAVVLYSLPDCEGFSFDVVPGKTNLTVQFDNQMVSFVILEEPKEEENNEMELNEEETSSVTNLQIKEEQINECLKAIEENEHLKIMLQNICANTTACPV